jgi:hypothetical protein
MSKDIFQKRGMYLEEEYHRKKEFELLEKLKGVFQKKMDKDSLREASGVTDEQLLDRMVEIQLKGEMMAAFQLYPLVEIAWADGDLSEREARSVLAAGEEHGIRPGTKAHEMLDRRLHIGPDPEVRKIWFLYADELRKNLTPNELTTFRTDLLERARAVVASTGHLERLLVDVGGERRILAAIEKALTK